jgi:hypothetical protein
VQARLAASKAAQTGKTYAQAVRTMKNEAKASENGPATQNPLTVLKKAPAAKKTVSVPAVKKTLDPAVQSIGCQTQSPEIQTTPASMKEEMAVPVCSIIKIMLSVIEYIEKSIIPEIRKTRDKDVAGETRQAFAQIAAVEWQLPLPYVMSLVSGDEGAPAPMMVTATDDQYGC